MDNGENKPQGVTYVDRITHKTFQVRARSVIVCAQALESTRLLLNSKTRVYTNGLGNSSGALGHYLMDHAVGAGTAAEIPELATKYSASQPHRANGIYVVRLDRKSVV